MTKTLEMVFRNVGGKTVTLSLVEPKEDITLAQVKAVMDEIVAKKVFTSKTGDLIQVVEARIASRDSAVLA